MILRLQNAADVAAWEEFAQLYGPVIFRVARQRGFQTADADNLIQEVWMAVAKSLSRWLERDDRGSFRAWLLRIAHNEAVDILTERATRTLGHDGSHGERLLQRLSVRNTLSVSIEREYELAVFRRAAEHVQQAVSERTWLAFVRTEVEGVSVQRTAKELGTTAGNIYVSRSRVMARIRAFVEQHEAEE